MPKTEKFGRLATMITQGKENYSGGVGLRQRQMGPATTISLRPGGRPFRLPSRRTGSLHVGPEGFPRQNAQSGLYTMAARFGANHAEKLRALLRSDELCRHFVIPATLKEALRAALRTEHGIWRGSLYPDSAGAAETAKIEVNGI
jgi:hypothetical protein